MIASELLERFRVLSLERVGRVETAWNRLIHVRDEDDDDLVPSMQREVHTLKGDAAVAGFVEVQQLCQKLEDLLEVAEARFEISEDFDLVVTMAIQFLGILLRVKSGAMTGLDLDGFVRQVDEVVRETHTLPMAQRRLRRASFRGVSIETSIDRLSEQTRQRLAAAATTVFLEYVSARGTTSRSRLRGVWTSLREELARMQVAELAPLLERYVAPAHALAAQAGKRVSIELAVAGVRIEPRVAEAVDIAVLHLIRNALDHGLETVPDRLRAGKPEQGSVRIRAVQRESEIEISVEDDGRGVDFIAVRARAVTNGLLDPAAAIDEGALLDTVFQPGFSTKSSVTDLSGRGVGMDAVKSAITRVGGRVRIATSPQGTTVTLIVPALVRQLHAYHFLAPGGAVSLAVSARWTPTIESTLRSDSIDPLPTIQLFGSSRQTSVERPASVRELSLCLRWGFLEVSLRAATEPRLVTAERICPTPDDHPVEVITIDGQETLLLRPEHVSELAPRVGHGLAMRGS
jgi:two-component system, chemotaxis family, sensor kinase CheA